MLLLLTQLYLHPIDPSVEQRLSGNRQALRCSVPEKWLLQSLQAPDNLLKLGPGYRLAMFDTDHLEWSYHRC